MGTKKTTLSIQSVSGLIEDVSLPQCAHAGVVANGVSM